MQAIPFADIEDLDDIMTGEPGGSARFLKESLHNLRFVREMFAENFSCEQAAEPSTGGREHLIPRSRLGREVRTCHPEGRRGRTAVTLVRCRIVPSHFAIHLYCQWTGALKNP